MSFVCKVSYLHTLSCKSTVVKCQEGLELIRGHIGSCCCIPNAGLPQQHRVLSVQTLHHAHRWRHMKKRNPCNKRIFEMEGSEMGQLADVDTLWPPTTSFENPNANWASGRSFKEEVGQTPSRKPPWPSAVAVMLGAVQSSRNDGSTRPHSSQIHAPPHRRGRASATFCWTACRRSSAAGCLFGFGTRPT